MKHRYRFLISALVVVALVALLALIAAGRQGALAAGGVIYVDADATGANTGTSWEDAYIDLQSALDAVSSHQEIWVAEGIYTPSQEFSPGDSRSATFQMKNDVAIYGGFDPGMGVTEFKGRDWLAHPTILSGDLDGNDGPNFANNEENSYHVLYHPASAALDATAILDGFAITGGNANSEIHPHWNGGGMLNWPGSSPTLTNCTFKANSALNVGGGLSNYESSPTLTNCTFAENWAGYSGGGMDNHRSSPTLTDCTFVGNRAPGDSCGISPCPGGGGMHNYYGSPTLVNCTFDGNWAGYYGGGMYSYLSSPTLTDCTFLGNSADNYGGGMYNLGGTELTLTNCVFTDNSATGDGTWWSGYGGGMYNEGGSQTLTGCIFSGNSASVYGGGMYSELGLRTMSDCTFLGNTAGGDGGGIYNRGASFTLTGCTFLGNSATGSGGGIASHNLSPSTLANCTFLGNTAGNGGGGMYNRQASPTVTNCTFWGNTAGSAGGGIYNDDNFDPSSILTNCILWSDVPDEIYNNDPTSLVVATYCDIQGGYEGEHNINLNPLFVDASGANFHLASNSPCIDVGNNAAPGLPEYDFEGDARVQDGDGDEIAVVDMGVDEYAPGVPAPVVVEIDIKPKTPSNVIKLGSRGAVPVAILTTGEFAATDADPDTVRFAEAAPVRWSVEDANGDGDEDLVLYFNIQDLVLDASSTEAALTGETFDGVPIEGTDAVRIMQ